jgi:predicted ATPase/DNA-binding winged helix-turn-helix (wHTH) protein
MPTPQSFAFSPWQLLPARRLLLREGVSVRLGGRAFDMLVALVERRDRTVAKQELMDLVWPRLVVEENNLQVQVLALRKLLGHAAIATVPGRGYRFTLPVIVDGEPASTPVAAAAERSTASATPTNLPNNLPTLYGRDADLRALLSSMDRHALVTVAGPGGIGKTRLAQAAAAARVPACAGGVWWVDLAALGEPGLLPQAVALAMGLRLDGAADVTQALIASWPEADSLLVLDNAEHLLGGVIALLARLRAALLRMRILITSQEVLHLADEQVFRPEPLALPADDQPQHIAASGAVALFVARAQAADRRFALDEDNRATVADICRRLDGIPLAIELAAARVPLLGINGVRQRLDQRLQLLTSGDRSALRRHQTLRAALEWSHHLLSAPEQTVLRRLGVFVGGFTLEAAQQVGEDEQGIDRWDVLEHLGALVDKSLVTAEGDELPRDMPRYRMLESTRLFALERLIESGESADVRGRHREHFRDVAEAAREQMLVGDPAGLACFDRERDNVLLALAWPQDDTNESGLRLAAATRYYWTSRGLLARGLELMQAVLDRSQVQGPSVARCQVHSQVAHYNLLMGRLDVAERESDAMLQAARELGDAGCLCLMLSARGFIELRTGSVDAAAHCAEEALALGRQLGDSHEMGNAMALQAAVHGARGENDRARQVKESELALRQRLHHAWSEAMNHLGLAQMAVDRGDPAAALPHLHGALALAPRVDSQLVGLHLIGMTAEWAAASGLNEAAVLLDAACVAHHGRMGTEDHLVPAQVARFQAARAALPPGSLERLQSSGRALPFDAAMAAVRSVLNEASRADFSNPQG